LVIKDIEARVTGVQVRNVYFSSKRMWNFGSFGGRYIRLEPYFGRKDVPVIV
jgi:hypothetical protein